MPITFTPNEIAALQKNPDALRLLAMHHDVWESEAQAMDEVIFADQVKHHNARWKELRTAADLLDMEFGL